MTKTAQAARHDANAGIAAAEEAATRAWNEYADRFMADYCRTHIEVFCDDLWAAGLAKPPHGRHGKALGPVLMRAKRAGLIENAGYRPSNTSNGSPKVLWRSLTYRSPTDDQPALF